MNVPTLVGFATDVSPQDSISITMLIIMETRAKRGSIEPGICPPRHELFKMRFLQAFVTYINAKSTFFRKSTRCSIAQVDSGASIGAVRMC